jgi:lactate dehydrogenase-like 2-hydroxyacid dehydrogenase
MKRILVTYRLLPEAFVSYLNKYELIFPKEGSFSHKEIIQIIPDCDALLSMFNFPITKEIIDYSKNLKIISNYGVGFNNIDLIAAKERNIVVTNTPDPVIEPTAELAFALMSDLSRNISVCNKKLKSNENIKWGVLENLGVGLWGKTLGIIGLGRIGKAVAKRALVAGMKIVYHNRHRISEEEERMYNATYLSKEELLQNADYVTIHTPLNENSFHLIDERALSIMKKGSFLINTARGAVVDEKALLRYLECEHIGGAALDVYENEPNITKGLLLLDNVVLVPHIGTATIFARNEMSLYAMENIDRFFSNKEVLSRVI